MHQKKRKLFVLYSIPIWFRKRFNSFSKSNLCNKEKLYLVSCSIPLKRMGVLLLIGIFAINPSLALKTSAVTIQDEWVVKENNSNPGSSASVKNDNSDSNISETSNDVNTDPVDDSFGGFGGDEVELSQEDADAGISLLSNVSPTLAITISNSTQTINTVQGGPTVYGSYNVGMTGSNVKDYTLSIKADSTNLTMPSGASSSTSTISGVGSKTGDSMTANTWGYNLTETNTSESSYGTLIYASLPTSLTQIANGTVASPYNLSASKKLVFAAKFGDNATPGKYTGSITLSLSATPAQTGQLWSNGTLSYITDMQDIKAGFCRDNSSIPAGSTIVLKDNRGTSPISYKIIKMLDGVCWMAENLRLIDTTIDSTNSDMASGSFTIPVSSFSGFNDSDGSSPKAYYAGDITYGAYYNWHTATAGTAPSKGDASGSICPKKWKLPKKPVNFDDTTGTGFKSKWLTGTNAINGYNGYKLGYDSDDAFWPAAGYVDSDFLNEVASSGHYWHRDLLTSGLAYNLYFDSKGKVSLYNSRVYRGYSVRCVADY